MNNITGPNPFSGLSREQPLTIVNDESGTFTPNEKYASYFNGRINELLQQTRFDSRNDLETILLNYLICTTTIFRNVPSTASLQRVRNL